MQLRCAPLPGVPLRLRTNLTHETVGTVRRRRILLAGEFWRAHVPVEGALLVRSNASNLGEGLHGPVHLVRILAVLVPRHVESVERLGDGVDGSIRPVFLAS